MTPKKHEVIVFLGGGRITSALCAGLRVAGYRGRLVAYDRNSAKLRALRRESRVETARDLKSAVDRATMLVLAVRPVSVAGMLAEVKATNVVPGLCVSLAAGIPFQKLRAGLPKARWVRTMPSPVCRIARGLTAVCFDRGLGRNDRGRVIDFFRYVGQIVRIPESEFDVFTATFSSSHGYHAVRTLSEQAQRGGLGRRTAQIAAAHALCDGVQYWRQSGSSLDELLHEAATPGGTAAATMAAMDRAGYARVVARGLASGVRQARRNARAQQGLDRRDLGLTTRP